MIFDDPKCWDMPENPSCFWFYKRELMIWACVIEAGAIPVGICVLFLMDVCCVCNYTTWVETLHNLNIL